MFLEKHSQGTLGIKPGQVLKPHAALPLKQARLGFEPVTGSCKPNNSLQWRLATWYIKSEALENLNLMCLFGFSYFLFSFVCVTFFLLLGVLFTFRD
jgi:hypothetical protein